MATQDQSWMGQPGDVTETPQFKAWFGDSKVVDDHGRPLRVFHGTHADFKEFKIPSDGFRAGIYFTNSPEYAGKYTVPRDDNPGANIRPSFIRITNPVPWDEYVEEIRRTHSTKALEAKGYDGVITDQSQEWFMDVPDAAGVYIVFRPNQVWSAFSQKQSALSPTRIKTEFRTGWDPSSISTSYWLLPDGTVISQGGSHATLAQIALGKVEENLEEAFARRYHAVRVAALGSYQVFTEPTPAQRREMKKMSDAANDGNAAWDIVDSGNSGNGTFADFLRALDASFSKTASWGDYNKWTSGGCFRFAQALKQRFPEGEYVGIYLIPPSFGYFIHAGLRVGNEVLDADGRHTMEGWLRKYKKPPYSEYTVIKPMTDEDVAGGERNMSNYVSKVPNEVEDEVKRVFGAAEVAEQAPEIERDEPAVEEKQVPKSTPPPVPTQQPKRPKSPAKPKQPKEKPYVPPTENKAFKRWFGASKIVDSSGKPLVVYHGTTHDFDTFSMERGNVEGHYGKGFYFTTSTTDLENYSGEGPDLSSRIDREAERIFNRLCEERDEGQWEHGQPRYNTPEYNEIMAEAKEEAEGKMVGGGGRSMPCYLRMTRPVVVDKNGGTWFEFRYNDRTGEESGSAMKLYNAIMSVASEFGADGQKVWGEAQEKGDLYAEFTAYQFEKGIRDSDASMDMYDDEGDLASSDFIARVYQAAGFDGIIQKNADQDFTSMRMDRGTTHFIVWEPNQVKSAIGNSGRFDKKNPNITASADYKGPYAFYIEIPQAARDHFWNEPPKDSREFWAFRSRPRALKGERIIFTIDKKPVAEALVAFVEKPGVTKCQTTGKYEDHWKVYWEQNDFKKFAAIGAPEHILWFLTPEGEVLYEKSDTHHVFFPDTPDKQQRYEAGVEPRGYADVGPFEVMLSMSPMSKEQKVPDVVLEFFKNLYPKKMVKKFEYKQDDFDLSKPSEESEEWKKVKEDKPKGWFSRLFGAYEDAYQQDKESYAGKMEPGGDGRTGTNSILPQERVGAVVACRFVTWKIRP